MKRYLVTVMLILASKICMVSAQAVEKHGHLRVEGAHIVDRNDEKVALRGISLGWHNWWPQFY